MLHSLDIDAFWARFPAFEKTGYANIVRCWEIGEIFFNAEDGPLLSGRSLQLALDLFCAHCLALSSVENAQTHNQDLAPSSIVTRSTIDKISVEIAPPPYQNGFDFWANSTPYGQQLLALLKAKTAGGFYFGGALERTPFRKAGGRF